MYDDSSPGDLEGAWGWIFETLVSGALVPLSCVCCQSRGGRQRWYRVSTAHKENCLSCETTSVVRRWFLLVENWLWLTEMQISRQHVQLGETWIVVLAGTVSITISSCMMHFLWCPSRPKNVPFLFTWHLLVPLPAPVCKPLTCSSTAALGHAINHVSERTEVKNERLWDKKGYSERGHGKEAGEGRAGFKLAELILLLEETLSNSTQRIWLIFLPY